MLTVTSKVKSDKWGLNDDRFKPGHLYSTKAGRSLYYGTEGNEKTRAKAYWELYGNIFHQGTRYQATPYAMPFLYELIDVPGIKR